jgi:succinate dehydrogenase / fumarate reductase, membrane anchor subunit
MVSNVTSLTGNGLKDWLIQRATAIYFTLYSIYLIAYLLSHPHLNYEQWHALFHCAWFQIATVVALIALSFHSWVGIWTVTTDYLKNTWLRVLLQMLVVLWLLGQFIWGLMIVWGQ